MEHLVPLAGLTSVNFTCTDTLTPAQPSASIILFCTVPTLPDKATQSTTSRTVSILECVLTSCKTLSPDAIRCYKPRPSAATMFGDTCSQIELEDLDRWTYPPLDTTRDPAPSKASSGPSRNSTETNRKSSCPRGERQAPLMGSNGFRLQVDSSQKKSLLLHPTPLARMSASRSPARSREMRSLLMQLEPRGLRVE
ncbi:hypothetical protein CTAM01_08465 [Colletotrichum tamarilloi]|uniref:Uncharacterized protein n=1 Tax=Colletotrichum tamarilloi TaxID=1209934 RepID=A0ABQ9R6J6_9PEZI|nr:uncharacterized protein CTAM01_08465 [Colletotrichum tamarilloi]KAK1496278.1 hypothetical protein CTAM01_08465 [Colletotrichum tamarilloi]